MTNYIDPSRLQLGEEIGKGAFGVVLRGSFRDVDGQTHKVAIKQIVDESASASSSSAPTPKENFMSEVSITIPASKDSDHVVQCHGWTATRDGKLALVMKLYDKSLYTLIDEQDGRTLPLQEVVKIALDMAKGLLELHTKGIVFEDMKPSNVMLDAGSRAFLADFGVSKPMKELSKVYTKNAAGTYLYMPPEKLRPRCGANRRISFAADIWSFGVTVLQLLCSDFDAPYGPGMDVPDIVFMLHMDKEAPRVPAVPDAPELQHTLQACLSLDHNERPSAAQLVQTLQRISNHLGAATQPSVTAAQGSSQDARAAAAARRRLAEEAQERQEMVRRVKCAEQKKAAAATKTQQKQQQQQQQQQQQALHPLQLLGSPSCGTTLTGHSDRVSSVAYTPDGSTLVSGSWDKTIKLWNVASGKCSATLEEHSDRVNSVAISQDGRLMASGSHDKTFKLWDLGRRKFTATLFRSTDLKDMVRRGGIISMDGVAISPDGASLASCTLRGDSEDSTIGLWDTRSGNQKAELWKLGVRQKNVAFSSDGVLLASCGHRHLTIWDTRSARMIATLPMIVSPGHESTAVTSVVFSPDRAAVLSSRGKTIKVWDAKSWQCLKTLEGHTDGVTSVALTFGGQHAVSGSHDKTIKIWDWRGSGKCLATLEGHCNSVSSVAVSPDGKTLASGSLDKTIKLWRIAQ